MSYSVKNYDEQGGERSVIGGSLDVISGGDLDIESGAQLKIAGTAISETAAKLNTAGVWEREVWIENLGAGADIATRVLYVVPSGYQVSLASASIVPSGTASGVDDSNSSVWSLLNGTDEIVAKTYDASPAFPADGVEDSLGALHSTRKILAADAKLKLSVTNGTTADLPVVMLRLYGVIEKV
jgi:hypothetical protein